MGELDWSRSLVKEEGPSADQVVRMRHRLLRHIRSGEWRHGLRRAAIQGAIAAIPNEGVNFRSSQSGST